MGSSIILHPKYGVNPTMTQCFYCGKDDKILLIGNKVKKWIEAGLCDLDGAMHRSVGVVDMEPCQNCKEYMKAGIILISVKDGSSQENPFRTGGFAVIKESAIFNFLGEGELYHQVIKHRFCFVEDKIWNNSGLPKTI